MGIVAIRRAALVVTALLVLVAASFASAVSGLAAGPAGRVMATPPSAASVGPASTCDGAFEQVPSVSRGPNNNNLVSVAATAPDDAWAVGYYISTNGYHKTLAEHWDGVAWTAFTTPNPGPLYNDLTGVTAIASNDVWAVGYYTINTSNKAATFAEHWNGSFWKVYLTPNGAGGGFSQLFDVSSTSNHDVWAVGEYIGSTFTNRTLIEHWNGISWQVVQSPNATAFNNILLSVSTLSPTEAWAVGYYKAASSGPRRSLALHWNGASWTIVPGTFFDNGDTEIDGVTALSDGLAVGVGYGRHTTASARQSLQFNLSIVNPSQAFYVTSPGTGDSILSSVAIGGSKVWAVGFSRPNNATPAQTFVASATFTTTLPTLTAGTSNIPPTAARTGNVYSGVAAISPTGFWATGFASDTTTGVEATLTALWCIPGLAVTAPASTAAGSTFSVTVTATNLDGSTATGYVGTIHFTSSDPGAVLPGDYTFTPGDAGTHTFSGVGLVSFGNQTITATDTSNSDVSGSATISVTCNGACPAPTGTPGGRDSSPAPTSTPGPRDSVSSTAAGTAPRTPAATRATLAPTPATHKSVSVPRIVTHVPAAIAKRRTSSPAPAQVPQSLAMRDAKINSPAPEQTPWFAFLLLPLVAALALFVRVYQLRA